MNRLVNASGAGSVPIKLGLVSKYILVPFVYVTEDDPKYL